MSKTHHDVLAAAAREALAAPSVFNTQPWRWRIDADVLELRPDRDRHRVRLDQMPMLAIAVARASAEEMANVEYRHELMRWANRPSWSGDGIPADTTVQRVPRRVPVRELTLRPNAGLPIDPGGDRGAAYSILCGDGDEAPDWLRAGEALSAVLLTAVTLGLSAAPSSDVIEVKAARELVRGLLGGCAHPYLVLRFGLGASTADVAKAPRRDPAEAIQGLPVW